MHRACHLVEIKDPRLPIIVGSSEARTGTATEVPWPSTDFPLCFATAFYSQRVAFSPGLLLYNDTITIGHDQAKDEDDRHRPARYGLRACKAIVPTAQLQREATSDER